MSGTKILKTVKAVKTITFTAQASEGHNSVKVKSLLKWLKSGHEIKIQINGRSDRQKAMENIYKQIEDDVKPNAKFLQKTVKPESIRVTLMPTEEAANIVFEDSRETKDVSEEMSDLISEEDVFSGNFEKKLSESIQKEKSKYKKKS